MRALGKLGDPQAAKPLLDVWERLRSQTRMIGEYLTEVPWRMDIPIT
ncbi:MAG: hypothetical protein ACE5R6_07230 [Candidatus Heimdallarchaeota archaeon]